MKTKFVRTFFFATLFLVIALNATRAYAYGLASISIGDASVVEGDVNGVVNMVFTVTRTGDTSSAVTVSYTTADGTAYAGTDYTAQTGTVTLASGVTSTTISIPITSNTILQNNRTFSVRLTGVTNTYGPSVTLATQQVFSSGVIPYPVTMGDFNLDGMLDLTFANEGINSVSVLLNTTSPGAAIPAFATRQTVGTGGGLYAVSVGDLNEDGKPDLAVTSVASNIVLVLLNTTPSGAATLTFAVPQFFDTGTFPYSVVMGDINRDGMLDLVIANNGSNTVSVLLNTTMPGAMTPSFAVHQTFATGSSPRSVAVGDFNGDGNPDVAVTNVGSDTVSVLLNTTMPGAATPAFATQQAFGTGSMPLSIATRDLNGDGKPDLAVTNAGSNTVSVLLNTTSPGAATSTFTTQQIFSTGSNPVSIAIEDLNGDGKPDLAVSNDGSNSVSLLLNTTMPGAATSTFAPQQTFGTGSNPRSLAIGDLNGDGKPDLAVANYFSNTVSVLLNMTTLETATPVFFANQSFNVESGPLSAALGDFNGDGKSDVVSANASSNSVSVLLNTTTPGAVPPTFATQSAFGTGIVPFSVAVGDFNGDGKPDVVVANSNSNTVSVLLNTTAPGATTPTFTTQQTFDTGNRPLSVAVADLNGDGRPDLAVANMLSNSVSVFLNTTTPGAITPSFSTQQTFGTGTMPRSVAVADLNGDGRPDLAVANNESNNISVLLNTTTPGALTPTFAAQQTFNTGTMPRSVAVGDLNGDGKPDLAVANFSSNTVSVLLNTTTPGAATPTFAAQQTFVTGSNPSSVAVEDLNGDGKSDLAIANPSSFNISVLLNTTLPGATTPTFATQQTFGTSGQPSSVVAGDLNGNGKPDLAVANDGMTVSVLLNLTTLITTSTANGTITDDDAPTSIAQAVGNNQSTQFGSTFAAQLAADVRNANGNLVQGVNVTFTAPSSGASGIFAGNGVTVTITTDTSGRATAPFFTANDTVGGPYNVTASVSGVGTPAMFSLTNAKRNISTALASSQNPSTYSQPITFTATIFPSAATGTIQFYADGATLGVSRPVSGSSATLANSTFSAGTHVITATYSGDTNYNSSTGSLLPNQQVDKANTTTLLNASKNPSAFGQTVTLTATVQSSTTGTPTGAITFTFDSDVPFTRTLTNGAATYSTSALASGTHTITATYAGDTNFNLSATNGAQVVNNLVPTLTAMSPTLATYASPSFTLTVTGTNFSRNSVIHWNASDRPTTWVSDTRLVASITSSDVTTTNAVHVTVHNPAPGGGESNALSFIIGVPSPSINSLNPTSIAAGSAEFVLTVNGTNFSADAVLRWNGNIRPTTVISSTKLMASIPATDITAYGVASITVVNPTPLSHESNTLVFLIGKGNTTTTIISSANPSAVGSSVRFTVSVTSLSGVPTGTVDFYETILSSVPSLRAARRTVASQPLDGGRAAFNAISFSVGTHSMLAIYSGDANFNTSTSVPFTQTVRWQSYLPWVNK